MAEHLEVENALRDFVAERDWAQFHTPADLAKSAEHLCRSADERGTYVYVCDPALRHYLRRFF